MAAVSTAPATLDLTIVRGDDFDLVLTFQDANSVALDLTDSTWTAQVRASADDTTVLATFTVDTTDAATGVLVLSVAKTVTATLGNGVWDLQRTYTADSHRVTLLAGQVRLVRDVTR